jgi:hypothetical protein
VRVSGHHASVSVIVRFFVAPDDQTAAAVADNGPHGVFESLDLGNFDADEAMVEWESIFTGRSFEELVTAGEPRSLADAGDGEGPVLLAASASLLDALAGAGPTRIAEVGGAWAERRGADGEFFDPELAGELMGDLAELARAARGRGASLYCWMA